MWCCWIALTSRRAVRVEFYLCNAAAVAVPFAPNLFLVYLVLYAWSYMLLSRKNCWTPQSFTPVMEQSGYCTGGTSTWFLTVTCFLIQFMTKKCRKCYLAVRVKAVCHVRIAAKDSIRLLILASTPLNRALYQEPKLSSLKGVRRGNGFFVFCDSSQSLSTFTTDCIGEWKRRIPALILLR